MAVVINKSSSNIYIGNLTAAATVLNGLFVTPTYSAGTAALAVNDTAGDAAGLLLAYAVNTKIDEEVVADSATSVLTGGYLRLKPLVVGDTFTTDQFKGTYGSLAAGAIFAVGDGGSVEAVASRTPVLTFAIVEKTTLYGANALKLIVLTA